MIEKLLGKIVSIHETAKFQLGKLAISDDAKSLYEEHDIDITDYLLKHATCNWGNVSAEEESTNNAALTVDKPIKSLYPVILNDGYITVINVVTNETKCLTTVFLSTETLLQSK